MILYPTETIYGLGVNVLDSDALDSLFALKGRDERQTVSWLVRNLDDVRMYAEVSETAAEIAKQFLPGPLTLVLPAKDTVPESRQAPDKTIGFRISSDPIAQKLIADFWDKHQAPLTCTSANISGMTPETTPEKITAQFKAGNPDFTGFAEVVEGGERKTSPSTVIKVVGDGVMLLREGSIPFSDVDVQCK